MFKFDGKSVLSIFFCNVIMVSLLYVTLHQGMSFNVPNGYFHVFIVSESKFCALYNSQNHFQIRELVAEQHVFGYVGTTFGTFEKTCFTC